MKTSSRSTLLAMAAMASLGSLTGSAQVIVGGRMNGGTTMMRELAKYTTMGLILGSRGTQRRAGPGWTNSHAKRMAVKARNVKRHRASSRG